ncbi:alcohol dehydrogenase catalytic domain-containing protein [Streptomyces malaysiensis subsp. malaysiensis]
MKAIIYRDLGGPEVLQLLDRDLPTPGPGEVRVRVAVSGVNPTDWKTRSGTTRPKQFPEVTPHLDGAGTIDAVGEGVDRSRVGQRVWLFMAAAGRPTGTAAEFTVVPAERPCRCPTRQASTSAPHSGSPRSPHTARSPSPRTGRAVCGPGRSTARWCSPRAEPGPSGTR